MIICLIPLIVQLRYLREIAMQDPLVMYLGWTQHFLLAADPMAIRSQETQANRQLLWTRQI